MVRKGYWYKVIRTTGYKKGQGLNQVKKGEIVKALEYAPVGSWDVIDVITMSGKEKSVYSFQLPNKPIKKPKDK